MQRHASPRVPRETRVSVGPEVHGLSKWSSAQRNAVFRPLSLSTCSDPPVADFDSLATFYAGVDTTSIRFGTSFLALFFSPRSVCKTTENMHGAFVLKARIPLSPDGHVFDEKAGCPGHGKRCGTHVRPHHLRVPPPGWSPGALQRSVVNRATPDGSSCPHGSQVGAETAVWAAPSAGSWGGAPFLLQLLVATGVRWLVAASRPSLLPPSWPSRHPLSVWLRPRVHTPSYEDPKGTGSGPALSTPPDPDRDHRDPLPKGHVLRRQESRLWCV